MIVAALGIGWYQVSHNNEQETNLKLVRFEVSAKLDQVMVMVSNLDERLKREERIRDSHPAGTQSRRDRIPDGLVGYPEEQTLDLPRRWPLSDHLLAFVPRSK